MSDQKAKVEFYALSTCGWCKKCKTWLDQHRIDYDVTYMDLIEGKEKEEAKKRILNFTTRLSFPLLVIDDGREVIQGYQPERFDEVLG